MNRTGLPYLTGGPNDASLDSDGSICLLIASAVSLGLSPLDTRTLAPIDDAEKAAQDALLGSRRYCHGDVHNSPDPFLISKDTVIRMS